MTAMPYRRFLCAAAALALAGCPGHKTSQPPSGPGSPASATGPNRLVVLLVIDQWPAWAFEHKRPMLVGGGFERLLREGEWHRGRHPSPATLTAPGHALLGTGEPPAGSGILANQWWHRDLEKIVKSVEDPDGPVSSARWLRVPALGDAIAAAGTGAKAVSVSLKDRAAILMLGRSGLAIWYDKTKVTWTAKEVPPWLAAHAAAHPIAAHLRDVWTPLDPAKLAQLSGIADNAPGELGESGFGPTFPHAAADTKDPAEAINAMPIGNELVLGTALAAIDGEKLGADDVPDLLAVSLSAHDLVGHGWGHESWEMWDMTLRLDQQLAAFLAALDAKVGPGRWSLLVTSDHGAAPMTEVARGGRITTESLKDAANRAAIAELGPGEWIASAKYPTVFLSAAARAKPAKDLPVVMKKIMYALRSFPGIERVGLTTDFAGRCDTRTGDAFEICMMLDPERSGEIFYMPRRGWVLHDAADPTATAHGSGNDYDRFVPVIMLPPKRTPHAPLEKVDDATIYMVRISTVLAHWLGVTPPTSLPREPQPPPAPAP
ncbi:MAG: alkaline phosphatase family protein [Deltaproteobacteria bacterium]|nr:alkaline phosphatase family protein [Deltaproteobacteria bacterium]